MTFVSINGVLTPSEAAFISIDERGFRFGDGIFETIPIHCSVPYLWDYHLDRLLRGAEALRIKDATDCPYAAHAKMLLEANACQDGILRIYVSRGRGSRGYLPSEHLQGPTIIMQTMEGFRATTRPLTLWLSSIRKLSPTTLPTYCKLAQGVNATLARLEAADHDADDALMLSVEGHVAEAGAANIFWLRQGILYTPALSTGALAGVTRQRIMELSSYPVEEVLHRLETFMQAEAMVLTNASMGVRPVNSIRPLGWNADSRILAELLTQYRQADIAAACSLIG